MTKIKQRIKEGIAPQSREGLELVQNNKDFHGYTVFTIDFNGTSVKFVTWKDAEHVLSQSRKDLVEEIRNVRIERFDMAIGDSEDFERGFKQGFEVCWNKCLEKLISPTKPK